MGGSFSTMSTSDLLIVGSTIATSVLIIGLLIKNGNFSKKNNPNYGRKPFPRIVKILPFNWFNGWANWKSGIYKGKDLKSEIAYLGHQAIEVNNECAVIRSNGWLYVGKCVGGLIFGLILILGAGQLSKDYLEYRGWGGGFCSVFEVVEDEYVLAYRNEYDKSVADFFKREVCIIKRVLADQKKYNTINKKVVYFLGSSYWSQYLTVIGFLSFLFLLLAKAPPPLVFDRKKRLIYTQYKGKLYISDWDKAFYTVRYTYQAYSIGFELFHLNKKGEWEVRWFTIAGHHYFGELCEFLMAHKAINSDRSHAMRAWLILYMEKGELAVHPVLPFKGILDYMTPRQEQLDDDIDQQVEDLLAKMGEAPGEAEKVRTPSKEIQQLLKRNNDLDLYDILSEKNLAKYIALRDAKVNEKG